MHRNVRYQESTKQTNRRKAEDYAATFRTRLIEGELDLKRKETAPAFDVAMQEYLEWSKEHHAAHPNTTIRYVTSSRALLDFFGKMPIDAIEVGDIEKFRRWRKKQKGMRSRATISVATVNREHACLKAMLNYFVKKEILLVNQASKIKLQAEDNERMRILTPAEEAKYLSVCNQPLKDIAILMLETGMRPDEVVNLRQEDFDEARRTIRIAKSKTKAGRRTLALTERALGVLTQRKAAAAGKFLFPHFYDVNQPMIKSNHAHTGALKRSGLPYFRLYDCRHTFATRAVESGVDLVTLAALLGHAKINMVLRYAHPTAEHQAQAIQKLETFNAERRPVAHVEATAEAGAEGR